MAARSPAIPTTTAANATTTGGESASERDSTRAVRDTARGSKQQAITAAIKGLFRTAAEAITHRDDDENPAPRRREGETEGEFQRLARQVAGRFDVRQSFRRRAEITRRYIALPAEAHEAAARYVADTLNAFNQWNCDDINDGFDESFEVNQNYGSLDL